MIPLRTENIVFFFRKVIICWYTGFVLDLTDPVMLAVEKRLITMTGCLSNKLTTRLIASRSTSTISLCVLCLFVPFSYQNCLTDFDQFW